MAANDVKQVYDFLDKAGTYYLATTEGDQPRVRPFGTALLYEDKIYILTGTAKKVSKQINANNKFEISAMVENDWIRVSGELVADNRIEVQEAILEKYPHLKATYKVGDANTNTLYISNAKAKIESFTKAPVELEL